MKKKFILISVLAVTAVLVFNFVPLPIKDITTDISSTSLPQDILIVNHYTNYAWGYDSSGNFIDHNGNMYEFDFSDLPRDISEKEMIQKMKEITENSKYIYSIFTEDDLKYLYELSGKINPNAEFNKKHRSYDAGQHTLYAIRYNNENSPEFIKIYSDGDFIYTPKDMYARRFYNYYTAICAITKGNEYYKTTEDITRGD